MTVLGAIQQCQITLGCTITWANVFPNCIWPVCESCEFRRLYLQSWSSYEALPLVNTTRAISPMATLTVTGNVERSATKISIAPIVILQIRRSNKRVPKLGKPRIRLDSSGKYLVMATEKTSMKSLSSLPNYLCPYIDLTFWRYIHACMQPCGACKQSDIQLYVTQWVCWFAQERPTWIKTSVSSNIALRKDILQPWHRSIEHLEMYRFSGISWTMQNVWAWF